MIYLDNAATTKISKEAYDAMTPYLLEEYGNPSGVYSLSRSAPSALVLRGSSLRMRLKQDFRGKFFLLPAEPRAITGRFSARRY